MIRFGLSDYLPHQLVWLVFVVGISFLCFAILFMICCTRTTGGGDPSAVSPVYASGAAASGGGGGGNNTTTVSPVYATTGGGGGGGGDNAGVAPVYATSGNIGNNNNNNNNNNHNNMRTSATANNNKDVRRQSMPQQQQQQQHQSQSQSRPQSKNFGTKSDIPVENRDNATLDSTEIDTSQFLYKCTKCRNRYAREVDLQIHVKARHGDEYETLVLTKSWEIKPSELKYLEKLGSGAYGIVFKARFKGELVAVKQLKNEDTDGSSDVEIAAFEKEAELMKNLPMHENVIKLVGVVTLSVPLCIVTQFAANGSLDVYLKKRAGMLAPSQHLMMVIDACKGIQHLHAHKIIHRDIAARNMLLQENGRLLVSDFGLSRVLQGEQRGNVTKTTTGPLRYMAPESMTQQMYSSMSDVWSFGVFMWEVFADAAQPYEPLTPTEVAIQVCRENLRLQRPKNAMPGAFELMQQCWAERPRDRITFDALYAALSKLAQGAKKYDNYWIPNT